MSTKIQNIMRARFWELDDMIKKVEARLKPIDDQRNEMAPEEALLRKKRNAITARKQKIIIETNLAEMAKERSGCSGFLKGKTGVHP